MGIWVVSTFGPLELRENIPIQACVAICLFLLRVESLGHMVNLCLTPQETLKLFSKVAVPFYIPTGNVRKLPFLPIFYCRHP